MISIWERKPWREEIARYCYIPQLCESESDFLAFCKVDAKIMPKTGENIIVQLPMWIEDSSWIEALMLTNSKLGKAQEVFLTKSSNPLTP